MHDNIETFMAVCDACKRAGVKLVYASSSTANSPNTTSLYGISKRFDEEYARCYNPQATGVRLHNVYGPNPRQGTLLWHLLNDNPVRLVNGGRNVRHFTYIDDVVEGLIYAWGCNHTLINIATPNRPAYMISLCPFRSIIPLKSRYLQKSVILTKSRKQLTRTYLLYLCHTRRLKKA